MDASRKTAKHPESENDRRDADKPEAREAAASELLSPAMPPAGAGAMLDADPRLSQVSETEQALERATEPSDTNEPAEANQGRKSGNTKTAGA
jgi:hypothetical protein